MVERDNEKLWQIIKDIITSLEILGTKKDQWSARKAQMAVRLYKSFGGGYYGKKEKNNSLVKWGDQNWRTKSGLPSNITGERYLPEKAIENLTPAQYALTTKFKQLSSIRGEQFSRQPQQISNITRKYRQ